MERVENLLEGKGIGRKSLAYLIEEFDLDIDETRERLEKNGIELAVEESFHDIAERYDTNPIEIVKAILVKGYNL